MCLFTYKVIYKELKPEQYEELSVGIGGIKIDGYEATFYPSAKVSEKLRKMPVATMSFLEPYEKILDDGILFKGIETKFGYFHLLGNNVVKIYIRRKTESWKRQRQ